MPIKGYKKSRTVMDFIIAAAEAERRGGPLTYKEWCHIRRYGTPDEIAAAVERMEAAGGYDNLE